VLHNTPADITVICDALPAAVAVTATDYSTPVNVVYQEKIVPGENPGEFYVYRTWSAIDACGNTTVYTQIILWIPDTFIDCDILMPDLVECNSHGVTINSDVEGGIGPFVYEWEIEGEKCFIQSGQNTPSIDIYIGFGEVDIFLTVTDAFGCQGVCNATLDCIDPFDDAFAINPVIIGQQGSNESPTTADPGVDYLRDLSFWPNPTAATVNVRFECMTANEVEISFTNYLGQIVKTEKVNALKGVNTRRIDVSNIPEGTYLMQVKTEKEVHTNTIVIMRK
jgi:hypothetical protein